MSKKEVIIKITGVVGIVLAVYALFRYVLPLIIPFLLGYIVAGWLEPFVRRIAHRTGISYKIGGTVLLLIISGIILSLVIGIVMALAVQLKSFIMNIPILKEQALCGVQNICGCCDGWFGIKSGSMYSIVKTGTEYVSSNYVSKMVPELTKSAWGMCLWIGSVAIVTVFFLLGTWMIIEDYEEIHNKINSISVLREFLPVVKQVKYTIGAYFKTQGIIMVIIFIVCSVTLYLMGNPYALLIGLIIAAIDALPILGSGSILVPWALVNIIQGMYIQSGILIALYLVCLIIRETIEPRIMGHQTGLSPVYVLASFYIGIKLFGVAGVILGPIGMVIISSLCKLFLGENDY